MLKPGISAQFAFLPDGLDPDDLVRSQGPAAFEAILARTKALFDVMWERELASQPLSTPEQRAAMEQRLKALVGKIADPSVRSHYEQEARQTLWSLNRAVVRELAGGGPQRGASEGRIGGRQNNVQTDWRVRERARLPQKGRPPVIGGGRVRKWARRPPVAASDAGSVDSQGFDQSSLAHRGACGTARGDGIHCSGRERVEGCSSGGSGRTNSP